MSIINQTLENQYRVDAFVASGGMGTVYRVWDLKRNVPLAMKVLHAELAEDPSIFKYFQREARALKKLAHPNIVPFYGLFRSDDMAFLLERYIEGPTLKHILKQRGGKPLAAAEALPYLKALSSALGYAHALGVVHCDVKPGNVMVDRGGAIYLTDFGVARHADSTVTTLGFAGTATYMAPEQCRGEAVTAQTDVYALGVMLFEMVTAQRPFRGDEPETQSAGETIAERMRYAHQQVSPPDPRIANPKLAPALAQVILTALAKRPQDRHASARQFYEAACAALGVDPDAVPDHASLPADLWRAVGIAAPQEAPIAPGEAATFQREPAPGDGAPSRRLIPLVAAGGGAVIVILLALLLLGKGDRASIATPTAGGRPSVTEPPGLITQAIPPTAMPTTAYAPTVILPTTPSVVVEYTTLGYSAGGRAIELVQIGYPGVRAIVVVGSIDGTQVDTRDAVDECVNHYSSDQSAIPPDTAFYFIPSINPDGNAHGSRYNDHQVDLNRNWATGSWTSNAPVPGYPNGKPGAGGDAPFSEPETQALRDLIMGLKRSGKLVVFVVLHSSQGISSGEAYAGETVAGSHHPSEMLTQRVAQILGYSFEDEWAAYDTPGNVIEWTAEQGIPSVDIVWPKNRGPSVWDLRRAFEAMFR